MLFRFKKRKAKPIMKMVTQGQRAYGEDWREVTIGVNEDTDRIEVLENKATEAPASGRGIYVPAMGEMDDDRVQWLLDGARQYQAYSGKAVSMMPMHEFYEWLNQQWLDYAEQKLRWFQGKTTLGPGGFFQRERSHRE